MILLGRSLSIVWWFVAPDLPQHNAEASTDSSLLAFGSGEVTSIYIEVPVCIGLFSIGLFFDHLWGHVLHGTNIAKNRS